MTLKTTIIWIDDEKKHRVDSDFMMKKCINLEILFFHPKEFLVEKTPADLYLLDDRLYQHANDNNEKSNQRGLTLAAEIRVKYPEIPIYIFTNEFFDQGIFGSLSQASEGLADEKIYYKQIQREGAEILYNDSLDYKKIRDIEKLNFRQLLKLLNPPEDTIEDLLNALPEVLKGGLRPTDDQAMAEGNSLFYGKWIKKTLLAFPGFVYDSLFAATSVGLPEEKFLKLKEFKPAIYDGLFSKTRKQLWWKRKLNQILIDKAQKSMKIDEIGNPYSLAEKIYKLKDTEKLKCVVCGEKYPETIAFNKTNENEKQPVHYSCSEVARSKENKLFFEEIRYFEYMD
jgi:hypothetical protein